MEEQGGKVQGTFPLFNPAFPKSCAFRGKNEFPRDYVF